MIRKRRLKNALKVMKQLQKIIKPGISTGEINGLTETLIAAQDAAAAFKGYKGFPAAVCTSINEEIVHGIPGDRKLEAGDIISLDLGINYQGYYSDAAITMPVGAVERKKQKLIDVTKNALYEGIKAAKANRNLSDISYRIQ